MATEIAQVETIPIRRELDERFANSQQWYSSREYCLVKLTTTDGLVGWGECYGPIAGNREIVNELVAPWLVGRDARDVRKIHEELQFTFRARFHTTIPATVGSGVDVALWDVLGKSLDQPVYRLLGSQRRTSVRAYATGHYFRDVDTFEELKSIIVEEAVSHVEAGFDALKNKVGLARNTPWGPREDVELVRAIREAIGDDVRLMTDANQAYSLAKARRVGQQLHELGVHYFEEPIPVENVEGYAELNHTLDVPIAGGECWAYHHEFGRVIDRRAVDYVQPDLPSCGGFTTAQQVATMAHASGVRCVPHVWGTAISIAAGLQLIATIPGETMIEFDRTPNPIRDGLVVDPIENDGNSVRIPDGPGLGIEIDTDALEELRVD